MGTKNKSSGTQFNPKKVTQGITLVCPTTGNPIHTVIDANGKCRLATDTQISVSIPEISVELDGCNPDGDSVHLVDRDNCHPMKVEADGSINVNVTVDAADGDNIAISAHSSPIFDEASDTITTTSFEEIFSFTSTNNDTRIINIECYVETPCTFRVLIGGVEKKRKSSSSTELNINFEFKEHRPLLLGTVIKVEAQVDRFFSNKSPYSTFCSLEGYLS